jgi:hypothetical protein
MQTQNAHMVKNLAPSSPHPNLIDHLPIVIGWPFVWQTRISVFHTITTLQPSSYRLLVNLTMWYSRRWNRPIPNSRSLKFAIPTSRKRSYRPSLKEKYLGNSGLAYFNVGNTSPLLILEKNTTDDNTDYSYMVGIKERCFIKMLPALPCSVLKLSTDWDNETIHEDRRIMILHLVV